MSQHLFTAFILTALAGLSTGIGSLMLLSPNIRIKLFYLLVWGFPPVS